MEAAQKLPGAPRLTAAQEEALDLHAEVCEELAFTMELEPGDLQLLNNHVVYHGRTAYEDADGPDRDRLLLRLWLAPPNSRELPPGFEALWGSTAPGAPRGCIAQPGQGTFAPEGGVFMTYRRALVPSSFDFFWPPPAPVYGAARAKQLLAEAGYPSGFDAGEYSCDASYSNLAEAVANNLQAVGIRVRLRPLERAGPSATPPLASRPSS